MSDRRSPEGRGLPSWVRAYLANYRGLPTLVYGLALVQVLNRAGAMVLPFLPLWFGKVHGFEDATTGLLMASYGSGAVLGTFLGGHFTDWFGARRTLLTSLVLAALGLLVLGRLEGFVPIAVGCVLLGGFTESHRPAISTLVARATPDASRPEAMAFLRLAVNLGMSIGPVVGGALALHDYAWLFPVNAATCTLAAVTCWFVFRWTPAPPHAPARREKGDGLSPWRDRPFLGFVGLTFIAALVFLQVFNTYGLDHERRFGFDEFDIGLLFAFNTLLIVFFEMPLTRLLRRRHPLRLTGLGMVFVGLGLGMVAFDLGVPWLIAAVFVWTLGEMLFGPFGATYTARRAPPGREGAWFGLFNVAFSTAFLLAPLLGFAVLEHFGPRVLWALCCLLGVGGWPLYLLLARSSDSLGRFTPRRARARAAEAAAPEHPALGP